jgi:general secretion pathway protein I
MKNKIAGFTLIEVLIALVILSIAVTAIIKATSQNIKDTLYIQKKTIALWVGNQIINEIIVGLRKPPLAPDVLKDNSIMLNEDWSWEASLKHTPNPRIQEINVDVYQDTLLIHLMSYLYAQQ